jgi:hypothetical protein
MVVAVGSGVGVDDLDAVLDADLLDVDAVVLVLAVDFATDFATDFVADFVADFTADFVAVLVAVPCGCAGLVLRCAELGGATGGADAGAGLPSTRTLPFASICRNAGLPAGTMPSCAATRARFPGAWLAATSLRRCSTRAATSAS